MARSGYVYVVVSDGNGLPDATFTVKHEMHTWLVRNLDHLKNPQVWRYSNGLSQEAPVLVIGRGAPMGSGR